MAHTEVAVQRVQASAVRVPLHSRRRQVQSDGVQQTAVGAAYDKDPSVVGPRRNTSAVSVESRAQGANAAVETALRSTARRSMLSCQQCADQLSIG